MPISPISGHMPLSQIQVPQHATTSPLLEQGNRLFEQSVRRGPLHFQSSSLKHLCAELRQLQNAPSSMQARRVQDAIQHWENHHPKEVMARSTRLAELKQALAEQGTVGRTLQSKVMATGPQVILKQPMPALPQSIAAQITKAQTGCTTTLVSSATAELIKHNQSDQQHIKDSDGRKPVNNMPPPPPPPMADKTQKVKKWVVNTDSKQLQALRYYSAQGYNLINTYLRGGEYVKHQAIETLLSRNYLHSNEPTPQEFDAGMRAYIQDVTEGLNELAITDHKKVYRGLKFDKSELKNLLDQYTTEGNIIAEKGFLSTSPDKAWVNDTILVINLESGHKGRILGDAAHFKGEAEMLFPPESKMLVEKVLNRDDKEFDSHFSNLRLTDDASADTTRIKRIINIKMLNE
ncbi:ADP-ribosyltransferase [Photorhabdus sp. RW14-46]|uniref:ADP-ribosyltransferase n=1 Tax=Photorhabdus sp. RW14-46 TaxID=2100168 RepID=UPI00241821F2|nr:ADP-ribosyltransferase [Photorhabdus sp. RW14-46]